MTLKTLKSRIKAVAFPQRSRALGWMLGVLLTAGVWGVLAGTAAAAAPPLLWQVPEDGAPGGDAGRLDNPRGVATSPITGDVYVAETFNQRVSQFTGAGEFIRAWGWGVLDGSPQLQTCTVETGCRAGLPGAGAGQLARPMGIAIDSLGAVYVYDRETLRVQKFDAEGHFLLMFGGGVNQTTGGNLCTAASGDTCGPGSPGPSCGEFSTGAVGGYLAIDNADTIYVGDAGRIEKFDSSGVCLGQITGSGLAGKVVMALAVDPVAGGFYAAFQGDKDGFLRGTDVYRLDSSGVIVGEPLKAKTPRALATDEAGNVYVAVGSSKANDPAVEQKAPTLRLETEVIAFDAAGQPIAGMKTGDRFAASPATSEPAGRPGAVALGTCALGGDGLLIATFGFPSPSHVAAYGTTCGAPVIGEPEIFDQWAVSVGSRDAVVRARINPRLAPDTTYRVQYGTSSCLASGWTAECLEQPLPPGVLLSPEAANVPLQTSPQVLSGLEPGETYFYRFVAQSSGSGDEPVYGVGGKVGVEGSEASFTTLLPTAALKQDCSNQMYRVAAGALLPNCRAYEMVSPIDKNGGEIRVGGEESEPKLSRWRKAHLLL